VTVLILVGERDVRADQMVCALGDRGMPVFRADLGGFPSSSPSMPSFGTRAGWAGW